MVERDLSYNGRPVSPLLIVDDDLITLELLKLWSEDLGLSAVGAASYVEAMECAKNNLFEIVLTDLSLPDGKGEDLIRELSNFGNYYFVAFTGYDSSRGLLESGFKDCLTKPIDFMQFKRAILKAQAR